MADGLVAFEHELGNFYGNADLPWAETFDLNILNGTRLITVKQMLPDIDGDAYESALLAVLPQQPQRWGGGTADDAARGAQRRLCRLPHDGPRHPAQDRGRRAAGVGLDGRPAFGRRRGARRPLMAPQRHTPPIANPPPDLPNMPEAGPALTSYLRNFALWAKNGLAD